MNKKIKLTLTMLAVTSALSSKSVVASALEDNSTTNYNIEKTITADNIDDNESISNINNEEKSNTITQISDNQNNNAPTQLNTNTGNQNSDVSAPSDTNNQNNNIPAQPNTSTDNSQTPGNGQIPGDGQTPPEGFDGGAGGPGGPGNNNTSYSHGSSTIVESPDNTIADGYTINQDLQADASEGLYSKLFDTENIQEVNINISEDNWNYLLQNAKDKPTVLATSFSIGDETIENVGIKTKGNLTLNTVWQSDSDRFSFTINMSKFVKEKDYGEDQNFYGLNKLCLNNIYGDPSMMREYLSLTLMTKMGVATPYYSLVKLSINGEYYGLYFMVEKDDESLIERIYGDASGDLYQCESPGGSLIYNSSLDSLLNEDGTYNVDLSNYSDKSNPLSSYTGILENKEFGPSISDYKAKQESQVKTDINELFSWMKKLNELSSSENPNTEEYKNQVESIIDVDEVLRYFAANTYLVNLDSYQSEKEQNYALYLNNGKASIIPWDYNYSFGLYGINNASQMINFSIDNPLSNTTLEERPLLNILLQNDDYKALYYKYLADAAIIASTGGTTSDGISYEADYLNNIADKLSSSIGDAVKTDPTAFYTYDQYTAAIDSLKKLNTQRAIAVNNQLNGDYSEVSADGITLNIGGGPGGAPNGEPGGPGGNPPDGKFPQWDGNGNPPTPPDWNNQGDINLDDDKTNEDITNTNTNTDKDYSDTSSEESSSSNNSSSEVYTTKAVSSQSSTISSSSSTTVKTSDRSLAMVPSFLISMITLCASFFGIRKRE